MISLEILSGFQQVATLAIINLLVPYSIGWKVFSNLLKEEGIVIIPSESVEYGEAKLRLVYEDSLHIHLVSPSFWEHDPAFGDPRVPDVLIYEVSYEPS
jgi:hypothetical protein